MRLSIRSPEREPLYSVTIDPQRPPAKVSDPAGRGRDVVLEWDQALDDQGNLRRCPVCGCRELFVRKDFPQVTGLVVIVAAGLVATILSLGMHMVIPSMALLLVVVLVDGAIFFFTGRCLVCYRCRSEFRDLPIRKDHPHWELATGEKYKQVPQDSTIT